MYINRSSKKVNTRKPVRANEEIIDDVAVDDEVPAVDTDEVVEIDPNATDLLFEAEDVAELVAEVTGEDVEVAVDEDAVVFTVGEDEFTVTPEGDEEILEASRKVLKGKKAVRASKKIAPKKSGRPIRRV